MVLEESTLDETPTDAPDLYASPSTYYPSRSASAFLPPHIDISAFPHGLPIFGPLTGYTQNHLAKLLNFRFEDLQKTIHRPLTESEQTAVAWHTSKGIAISSYGPTLGIAAAGYRAWTTRAEMRWPFYGKMMSEGVGKGIWDGEKLRVGGKEVLKFLSVEQRFRLLHALRGSMYAVVGILVAPIIVSGYGATVAAVGEMKDERLKWVLMAVRQGLVKEVRVSKGRVGPQPMSDGRVGPQPVSEGRVGHQPVRNATGHGPREMGELWGGHRDSIGERRERGDEDDMSPTGGNVFDFSEDEERERRQLGGSVTGVFNDAGMQAEEAKAQPKQPQGFGDGDDDASPTARSAQHSTDDGSGLSTWDMIREHASDGSSSSSGSEASARAGRRQNELQERDAGDSFSFVNKEKENSYDRDKAQRSFDEKVEKERRGGDFGGGDGGDGW